MNGFEDLGIAPALSAVVESLGWERPTGVQEDALPVIRRGNNVVLHASAGAGATGAYALGVLDRLLTEGEDADDDLPRPAILVLATDADAAARTADSLARLASAVGLDAGTHGPGWPDRAVHVLVLTPAAAAGAVRTSSLKLDGLKALVLDDLHQLALGDGWSDVEMITDASPSGAQRIVVTGAFDERVDSYLERHVRRALTIPPRPADDRAGDPDDEARTPIRYRVVAEGDKAAAIVGLRGESEAAELAVVCRTADRAEALDATLAARLDPEQGPRLLVLPRSEADRRSTRADVVSADVPADARELAGLHARGGTVLVTPRERAHLHRIAARAGHPLTAVADPTGPADSVRRLRDRLRSALETRELAPELALLEPLLDEAPAAEIAAAALSLLRDTLRSDAAGPPTRSTPQAAPGTGPGGGAPRPSSAPTWTHLFVTIGSRDGVGPGDVVGAMTGEAGISGSQVGKIDIRESHTTVEVETEVAPRVIEALNGRTLKGRSLRVDFDRKARASGDRSGGGSGDRRGSGGGRSPGGRKPGGRKPRGRSGPGGGR